MASTSYIVIVGDYNQNRLQHRVVESIIQQAKAEVNIFNYPRMSDKDTVEYISDTLLVHRYGCSVSDNRESEFVRDLIAIGAEQYYIFQPNDTMIQPLYDFIVHHFELYGVAYKVLNFEM